MCVLDCSFLYICARLLCVLVFVSGFLSAFVFGYVCFRVCVFCA